MRIPRWKWVHCIWQIYDIQLILNLLLHTDLVIVIALNLNVAFINDLLRLGLL